MNLRYLSDAHERWVRSWWIALQDKDSTSALRSPELTGLGRGDRARLRRAASIEELEIERAAQLLTFGLLGESWRSFNMQQWMATDAKPLLVVAGVLAAVKQDAHDGHSLVWHMGQSTVGGGTPPMSELRFRRLLKVRRLEEFFTAARRAVALANSARGGADVVILADDLVAWAFERHMREAERPAQTMSFRWAQDYYRPQKGKDVDLTVNSKIEEGERA